jgi:predicted dehydrogenase
MLRMGLIGAGTMGAWYARTFGEYERSQLVAVCDLNEAKAQALAGQWQAATYSDYRDMLAQEQLDAVAVATPDRYHRAPVVACLEAGKHVL